jgi:HEAT repeat protein
MNQLAIAVLLTVLGQSPVERDFQVIEDEKTLKAANVRADGDSLLEFLRQQSLQPDEREAVAVLAKRLDDKALPKRDKAALDIMALGPKALPILRQAVPGATLEMRMRLERCIKVLEKDSPAVTAGAAVRLVKQRRPHGACAVLLGYLTSAPDEAVEEEVIDALAGLGVVGGRPDPLFDAALADPVPARRAAAALVLGRTGSAKQRLVVHLLLDDPDPSVQLRAAQGLLLGRDRDAVPALIGLLAKAPMVIAEQAEDILIDLAGKSASAVLVGDDGDARQKAYQAWRQWWQAQQFKIDLARSDLGSLAAKNAVARTREVSRLFIVGLLTGNKAMVRKSTDVPFVIAGQERIANREDWDLLLAQQAFGVRDVQFQIQKAIGVDEYGKTATPEEQQFINLVRKQPLRIVLGQVLENEQRRESYALFVRVSGGRARVIALGVPRQVYTK